MLPKNEVLKMTAYLNEMLYLDRKAISDILLRKVKINESLASSDSELACVGNSPNTCEASALGILCGYCGRNKDDSPRLYANVEGDIIKEMVADCKDWS